MALAIAVVVPFSWMTEAVIRAQAPVPPAPAPRALPLSGLPVTARATAVLAAAPAHAPAIGAGHVFVALTSGQLVAYRATDLTEAWTLEMPVDRPPVVAAGHVVIASGGVLHARHAADGRPAWTADIGEGQAPLRATEGWVIASGRQLYALRASDGSTVWATDSAPLAAAATIEGDRVYVPLQSGRVEARDLATGTVAWSVGLGGPPTEVLAFADRVFVGSRDGFFYTLDAATGGSPWQFPVRSALRGAPAAHARLVFTISLDNLLRAYDRGHGARAWNQSIPYRGMAGPLVVEGSVVVAGSAASLPVFDAASGTPQAPLVFPEPLVVPLAIGMDGGVRVLAAVIGSFGTGWQLVVRDASYSVPLAPLTALPGEVLPLPEPGKPPARQ
jgi:outer membrane protein assembly factor BamB